MGKTQNGLGPRKEVTVTLALLAFFVLSAIYRVPPLSYLVDMSESLKGSWVSREYDAVWPRGTARPELLLQEDGYSFGTSSYRAYCQGHQRT